MKDSERYANDSGRFLSVDCVDFWLDGPGDKTVRPIPAYRLNQAKAEREKIIAAEAAEKTTPARGE